MFTFNKQKVSYKYILLNYGIMLAVSFIILYFIETIYFQSFSSALAFLFSDISLKVFIINIIFIYMFQITLFLVFNNIIVSFSVTVLLTYILALVNKFKMNARGEVFTFNDISVADEALSVAGNYDLKLSVIDSWVLGLIIILIIMLGLFYVKRGENSKEGRISKSEVKKEWNKKIIISTSVAWSIKLLVVMFFLYNINFLMDWAGVNINVHIAESYYDKNGLLVGLVRTAPRKLQEPEEYSDDHINLIKNNIEVQNGGQTPNLIFVMNESLYDITSIEGLPVSEDPIKALKELQSQYTSGQVISSQIGGGTCNVEFEVITGCNIGNIGSDVMPYSNMINKDIYSLISLMNERGYYTTAFHPNYGTFFNRRTVYGHMGFEELNFFEEIGGMQSEGTWASDMDLYTKVIEAFESEERGETPFFSYIVTLQNHGGYAYEYDKYGIKALDSDKYTDKQQLETYSNLICSSVEAFRSFIAYFEEIDEPTVIVMFGDHAPGLNSFGYNMEGEGIDRLKYFVTPLIVYSNYELPQEQWGYVNAYNLAPKVLEYCGIQIDEFWAYALEEDNVATFTNYCYLDGAWQENSLVEDYNEIKENRWLMAYDRIFGKDYGRWGYD